MPIKIPYFLNLLYILVEIIRCFSQLSLPASLLDNNDNVLTVGEVAGEPAVHGHAGGGGPGPVAEHAGGGVVTLQLVSVLIKQN